MKRFRAVSSVIPIMFLLVLGCGEEKEETPSVEAPKVYILNTITSTITVYDIETGTVISDAVSVGQKPEDIKVLDGIAYIVNMFDNSVQLIDLKSLADVGLIYVGEGTAPERIAFTGRNKAYVTCNWENSVKVLDLAGRQVVKTIGVGLAPRGIVVAGDRAFVCNSASVWDPQKQRMTYGKGTLSVIDIMSDEVIGTVEVGVNPTEAILDAEGNVVVLCAGNYADVTGSLYLINPSTGGVIAEVDLRTTPGGIALSPNGLIYVSSPEGLLAFESGTLRAVHDVSNPLREFRGGAGLAFDIDGNGYICLPSWSSDDGRDKLLIMDKDGKLAKTVELGSGGGAALVAIY